jgi:hypothetical protein
MIARQADCQLEQFQPTGNKNIACCHFLRFGINYARPWKKGSDLAMENWPV